MKLMVLQRRFSGNKHTDAVPEVWAPSQPLIE